MLQNAPLIVKIGVDTEENEPPKNCENSAQSLHNLAAQLETAYAMTLVFKNIWRSASNIAQLRKKVND